MSFTKFQTKKMPFQAIKTRSKSRKIHIFPKGLTRGIGKKLPFFNLFFFFRQYRQGKCLLRYSTTKKAFLRYKNNKFKKSKNRYFSKRVNPWISSKKGHISNIFFQAIQPRKMSFTIFQNEKKPFKAIKTRSSKTRKTDIFPNGLTNRFGPKIPIFSNFFFFRQYRPGKYLLPYSTTKTRLSRL